MQQKQNKFELSEKDLKQVVGGATVGLSSGGLEVNMTSGSDSVDELFRKNAGLIKMVGGDKAVKACEPIIATLNSNSKITKCVINTSTFVPTYYIGSKAYTQSEIDNL